MTDVKFNNNAGRSNYIGLKLCFFDSLDSHSVTEIKTSILFTYVRIQVLIH